VAVIGIAALLLFGPDQLPKVARKAGAVMRDLQNTSQTFIREMERAGEVENPFSPSAWTGPDPEASTHDPAASTRTPAASAHDPAAPAHDPVVHERVEPRGAPEPFAHEETAHEPRPPERVAYDLAAHDPVIPDSAVVESVKAPSPSEPPGHEPQKGGPGSDFSI
jgi:Sec-independent protein translocase protein TatA